MKFIMFLQLKEYLYAPEPITDDETEPIDCRQWKHQDRLGL